MLFVKTDELLEFGEYLLTTKTNIDTLLKNLDAQMSQIYSSWSDKDGADFVMKFNEFIKEADNISVEINKLGIYAKQISSDYDSILLDSLKRMGD